MAQLQDADLWRALEDVQLKALVENLGQLDHKLLEHGANVSVGERQLICLARVLLQQNKIVILYEPTAHVDPHTEQTIWRIVREKMKDSTNITIAHRLKIIRDCDRILVLKNGAVDEFNKFDAPANKEGSTLTSCKYENIKCTHQKQSVRTGVSQGCLLSFLLFLVALDCLTMTAFDRKRGIQLTFTTSLEDLDFADELALLSHRIEDMRDKTRALEVQGAKVGLKINAMHQEKAGTKRGDGVSVTGEQIEEVDEFTYLGSIVSKKKGH